MTMSLVLLALSTAAALVLAAGVPLRLLLTRLLPVCLMLPMQLALLSVANAAITPLRAIVAVGFVRVFLVRERRGPVNRGHSAGLVVAGLVWALAHVFAYATVPGKPFAASDLLLQTIDLLGPLAVLLYARLNRGDVQRLLGTVVIVTTVGATMAAMEIALGRAIFDNFFSSSTDGYIAGQTRYGILRAAGFFRHSILMGVACACAALMAWALANNDRGGARPLLWRTAAAITGIVCLFSFSRAGWLALAVGLFARYAFAHRGTGVRALYAGAVGVVVVLMVIPSTNLTSMFSPDAVNRDESIGSLSYRVGLAGAIADQLADKPAGLGLGRIPEGELLGTYQGRMRDFATTVDNTFAWVAVRTGAIGLVASILGAFVLARYAVRVGRANPPGSAASACAAATLALLAATPTFALLSFAQGALLLAILSAATITYHRLGPPAAAAQVVDKPDAADANQSPVRTS